MTFQLTETESGTKLETMWKTATKHVRNWRKKQNLDGPNRTQELKRISNN